MKAILTYHSLDGSGSPISVAPEIFRRHVEWLSRTGVPVVPLDVIAGLPADADALALTFDDGFANFAEVAWPLLKEHGFPVTVFVVTGAVGATNAWGGAPAPGIPELALLGWPELRRLASEGVILGSHTRNHFNLTRLDSDRLRDEVSEAQERLEHETGRAIRAFAYPFGAVDGRVAQEVRRYHDLAVTTRLDWLRPGIDPVLLPRLDAYYLQVPGRLESWGTLRFRAWIRTRALLRSARVRISGGYDGSSVPHRHPEGHHA